MRLGEYGQVLRRRWWIIVLLTVLAATTALLVGRLQQPLYRSSVILRLETSRPDNGLSLSAGQLLRNMTRAINEQMYQQVNDNLRLDLSVDQFEARVKKTADLDLLAIKIEVDDTDPNRARDIARELGRLYEEYQLELNANIDPNNRINVVVYNQPREGGRIRPQNTQNTIAGALFGLLLGILVVVLLERLDNTIATTAEVERLTQMPVIGIIPRNARPSASIRQKQ